MVPVWMTFSDLFKVMIIQRQITWKCYNIQHVTMYLYFNFLLLLVVNKDVQWPTNRKSYMYMIYRTALFSMTLNDPYPQFQGHTILWRWNGLYLRNGTTCIHSVIEILIGTYTRLTQQCHFEWPWVISSDLAKYSMTRSVARSLCDSWASCCILATDRRTDERMDRPVAWSRSRCHERRFDNTRL